jgi:hypothetical protein
VKRTYNGSSAYYIYDGEKPILEYDAASGQMFGWNVYGKGIDEILARVDDSVNGVQRYYYQQTTRAASRT